MTKIRIIVHPNNPTRLMLQTSPDGETWSKLSLITEEHITRPLKTTAPDPDSLILQGIKIASMNVAGFPTWQDAATFLASIPDAEAYAASLGHNLQDLL